MRFTGLRTHGLHVRFTGLSTPRMWISYLPSCVCRSRSYRVIKVITMNFRFSFRTYSTLMIITFHDFEQFTSSTTSNNCVMIAVAESYVLIRHLPFRRRFFLFFALYAPYSKNWNVPTKITNWSLTWLIKMLIFSAEGIPMQNIPTVTRGRANFRGTGNNKTQQKRT